MSPAHPEIMAQTRIYQACLPRKKAIQQRMLGIFVQIKATRSIGSRVTVLPLETSGTQSGSDPQSGDSGQVQPGRTRNTAPSHHQCMHSTAVVGAPLGRPVFVLGAPVACKTIHGQAYLSRLFSCSCSPSFLPEGQSNQPRIFFSYSKFPPFGLNHFLPLSSPTHTHTHVLVYCPGFTAPVKGSAQNMTPSSAWVLPGRWDHSGVKESPHEAHGRPRPLRPQGLPEHKRRTDAGRWRGQTAGNHQVRGISGQEEDVSSYPTLLGFLHL